jgi:hypothetical protein
MALSRRFGLAVYRFPLEIIQQAIWLYVRFTLSFRDVEDLLAERGIMVSYETVRRWVNHFGPMIAANLRKRRPSRSTWDRKTPRARSMAQQPSREFTSTDPTTRTQDAGFQESGFSPKFLSTHAAAYNTFNVQRHLTSAKTHRAFRATAMQTWEA